MPLPDHGVAEASSNAPLLDTLQDTIIAGDIEPCFDGSLDAFSGLRSPYGDMPIRLEELSMLNGTRSQSQPNENIANSYSASSSVLASPSAPPADSRSVESRIGIILEKVRAEGFSDFDSVLQEYYTATLSKLSIEQRMSRNRRLPSTIAELSRSAQDWGEWERRGLQEVLVRSSEAVLLNELRHFRQNSRHLVSDEGSATGTQRAEKTLEIFHEQVSARTIDCVTILLLIQTFSDAKPSSTSDFFDL